MKVIKRDGRAVDFDRKKISIAIEKANAEVKQKYKAEAHCNCCNQVKSACLAIDELNDPID